MGQQVRLRPHVLAVILLSACSSKPPESTTPDAAEVVTLAAHDVSMPLREMAKIAMAKPRADRDAIEAEPVHRMPLPHMRYEGVAADPVVQKSHAAPLAPIAAPTTSFEGLGSGLAGFTVQFFPPDTDGDIGENEYFQVVNTGIAVFSRTGAVKLGPVDTSTLWMGFNGACANTNDGDATVRYDHIAKRWVVAQFSLGANFQGPFFQCVAVSTTSDPTGTYARFQFDYNGLNDYPKMGLWPDAYYFTFNIFDGQTQQFQTGKVCAMDRTKMLAGDATATMQCFDAGANFGGLLASDVDGNTMPAAGTPNYVVALDSNTTLAYWALHVDFATPANSTFTGPTSITVGSYTPVCNGGTCVTQPNTNTTLDSLADRAMNRFVYRRFTDHESLLLSHSVVAGGSGGIRWYELRTPATPTVFQQGTFAPDAAFRWLPSIAMDGSGDIALIYSTSSTAVSPSLRYTARVPSDPPGTMAQGEGIGIAGTGRQTGISRWGDYSAINVDPTNDCTFWGTHEYEGGKAAWSTRIIAFQLPGCNAFAVAADAQTVQQGGMATFPVTTMTTAGTPQSVALAASGLPAGVTATFSPTSVMSGTPAMITLTADMTAPLGPTHYTITGTGASSSGMVDVALTVEPAPMLDAGTGPNGGGGSDATAGCCGISNGRVPYGSVLLAASVLLVLRRRRSRKE